MTTFAPAAPAYRRVTGTPTWRAISRRHRVRLVETLEWISDRLRQKGEHGGPATHATIRVFRALLFRFANTATGVCLPGYKALAQAARTCERTAERAVKRLEALGVLWIHPRHAVWIAPDGTEVRVRTSNGYTFPSATGLDDLLGNLPGIAAQLRRLRERLGGWRQRVEVTTPGEETKGIATVSSPRRGAERQVAVVLNWHRAAAVRPMRSVAQQLRALAAQEAEWKARPG
jgi:hypothetical protein